MTVFVDTNVLVYGRDASEPTKGPAARTWMDWLWRTRSGRVSVQVLNEYYVTLTRKLKPGLPLALARADIVDLWAWRPQPIDTELMHVAWAVQDRFGLSFWDSLVVAAAKAAACEHLLTEDLQDGQDLDGVRVLNPFTHGPDVLS